MAAAFLDLRPPPAAGAGAIGASCTPARTSPTFSTRGMDPGHLLASSSDAMPAAAFSKLSTNDDSLTVTLARPGAGEGEGEQMLDASLELQPRSPAGDRTVDEDAKIARLKDALAEGVRTQRVAPILRHTLSPYTRSLGFSASACLGLYASVLSVSVSVSLCHSTLASSLGLPPWRARGSAAGGALLCSQRGYRPRGWCRIH
jgi:hypothetical protein